jgi:hypothetical protein
MIIVPLCGGLGNQMFQYAFSMELEKYRSRIYTTDYFIKRENAHNGYELKAVFNIDLKSDRYIDLLIRFIRKLRIFKNWHIVKVFFFLMKFGKINLYEESEFFQLDPTRLSKESQINVLTGYWQSEYFFIESMDKVRAVFSFNYPLLSTKTKEALFRIKQTQSVSIHIRRGDFLSEKNRNTVGSICKLNYYKSAIDLITDKTDYPFFFIFSDDILWAIENFTIPNVEFISWNKKEDSWQDMFLMSECKHNIIANSTFSWWGAWLNRNMEKIVIAPSGFTYFYDNNKNIKTIPEDWIIL